MTRHVSSFYNRGALFTILGFGLFRIAIMGKTGLGDSESYYWAWSRKLDLSYYDHPPLTAWLIRLFTELGGNSVFMVRLPSAILFVATGWLLYKLSRGMFDDSKIAFYAVLTFNLIPEFAIGAMQMIPDMPAAFCYTAFVLTLWNVLENRANPAYWYLLGAILGLGLLGKYFDILLVPSAFILLVAVPSYRFWLFKKEPYLALLLAFFVFSPVLFWNISNDFASFRFHMVERHHGAPFEAKNFSRLFAGQALYVSPLYLIAFLFAVIVSVKRAIKGDRHFALLASFSAPTLLFFYTACAWTTESEPHWPAFGYLTATVALAAIGVEGATRWTPGLYRWAVRYYVVATILAALMFILFFAHLFHPMLPIKPKYDVVNELYGWDKVGNAVLREREKLQKQGITPVFISSEWIICSQVLFATQEKIEVACVNRDYDQYDFWQKEKDFYGRTAIIVTNRKFYEWPSDLYLFKQVKKVEEVSIIRGGEEVEKFTIWKGDGFMGRDTVNILSEPPRMIP